MSGQLQCPNCGGYKTETTKVEDVSVKEEMSSDERKKRLSNLFKTLLGVIFIVAPCSFLMDLATNPSGGGVLAAIVTGGAIILLLFGMFNLMFQKTKDVSIGKIYYYYCYLCGYKWSWKTGTSLPMVNVRPDLIEQGNQRLEAERKKQQDDAAALYYLTHKK